MPETEYDIIIIGAGASGLIAANELLDAGCSVCILEAAAMAGGRIATLRDDMFEGRVECGAEFIHGDLPLTLQLLQDGNIPVIPVAGKMTRVKRGKWHPAEQHNNHWDLLMHQLGQLKTDLTIYGFLQQYFPGEEYKDLRSSAQRFAEGFDLADIRKASIISLKNEWMHENDNQYRIAGGYSQLIGYLQRCINQRNGEIYFTTCVKRIQYDQQGVTAHTANNREFRASKIIVSVSAGILQSGDLEFFPAIPKHIKAYSQLGYGSVIKILLRFGTNFWEDQATDLGFVISDETIPTWWTQYPEKQGLLTGWLGGPGAVPASAGTSSAMLRSALLSLSSIFNVPVAKLEGELVHHKIICWDNNPFIKGGYSYNTLHSQAAKEILSQSVKDRIFFAGEAVYDGDSQGTVEAALQSGIAVAKKIRDLL